MTITQNSNIYETKIAKIWLAEDGIVRLEFKLGAEFDVEDAHEFHEVYREIGETQGRKILLLSDAKNLKSTSKAGRTIAAGEEASALIEAAAALIPSPLAKMLASLFLHVNKPLIPFRMFADKTEALAWLATFQENKERA